MRNGAPTNARPGVNLQGNCANDQALAQVSRRSRCGRLSRFSLNFGGGRRGRQAAITGSS